MATFAKIVLLVLFLSHRVTAGTDGAKTTALLTSGATYLGKPVKPTAAVDPSKLSSSQVKDQAAAAPRTAKPKPKVAPTDEGAASSLEVAALPAIAGGSGRKLQAISGGRKLQASSSSCRITIKNLCRSYKIFSVRTAFYSLNALGKGLQGWDAQGNWNLGYGQVFNFYGDGNLYVRLSNRQRLSTTGALRFCVSNKPFRIVEEDDGWFYTLAGRLPVYWWSCRWAGGFWEDGYYPAKCGVTYTVSQC